MRSLPSRRGDPLPPAWLTQQDYAHRGLHGGDIGGRLLPENSPSAFAAAIARGMGIECDIQRSRDGQAMVFHDWELDRLTGESGPVASRDAAELSRIALTGSDDCIPRLADVLALIAGQVPLLIEIKSKRGYDVAQSCAAVARELAGYAGPHGVMSFDPRVGRWFARHSPDTPRGLVVTEENDWGLMGRIRRWLWLRISRPDFLAYDIRDLPSPFASAWRAQGMPLLSWTVRSPELRLRASRHADAPIAEGGGVQ